MRRIAAVLVVIATAILLIPTSGASKKAGPATAQEVPPAETPQDRDPRLRNGCDRLYTQRQFKRYSRAVYRRDQISRKAKLHVISMMRCQHSPKAERKMRTFRRQQASERRQRIAVARITPYGPCYGGRWAIPCSIVGCESGGSWSAYNPSGARGPYQFLGKPDPWPANTPAKRLRHHQIAAGLWAGGRGAGHWEQCL